MHLHRSFPVPACLRVALAGTETGADVAARALGSVLERIRRDSAGSRLGFAQTPTDEET